MKFSGKLLISFFAMAIAVVVIINAMEWPFKTALFPTIVGAFLFFGGLTDLLLNLLGPKADASKQGVVDFQLSDEVDQTVANRRTLVAFGWIIGFFLLILVVGFPAAIPLLVFLFLKVQAREKWGLSLLLTAVAFGFFYFLFVWLLDIPFSPGWLFEGLKALGVGK
jgi:hypothetical protein